MTDTHATHATQAAGTGASGTDAPGTLAASIHLITDLNTCLTNGPTAATQASSIAASGKIVDYPGTMRTMYTKLTEAQQIGALLVFDTDPADPSLATLQNVLLSLS